MFPLQVFPESSLASSVVTTVWIGVMVVAFFNLRLGWVLSGLVVPGYLVPLLIAKPWSAVVVLVEGMLTYWLVWMYSEYLSRFGKWGNLFGRDRFFALFLVSVAVRIVVDGWLLPVAGASFNDWFGMQFDYRNNLHSFGLIIVALVGNQFWKAGFLRGSIPLLVTIGLTYLIVRYGLMEFTNYSISGVSYMYEDIASSMLASPKAYIILIVTALLASRMNLHYGWDFNGILIPALLALQWYQPTKILISFVEAFVIYGLAIWVLRAPIFKQVTIEGARKLLLFFNIGFAYKLVLAYLLMWFVPELKISDFFAFGYLLSTLIAIKMHDKDIAARLTRSTLQTSLVAVLAASVAGYSLTFLPQFWSWPVPAIAANARTLTVNADDSLLDLVRQDKVAMYQSKKEHVDQPLPQELDEFARGLRQLLVYSSSMKPEDLDEAKLTLARVNYAVSMTGGGLLYLREKEPRRGWGVYVLRPHLASRLAIEVPAPLDERGTAEAGVALFNLLDARALAVGGSLRNANPDGTSDVLRNYQTFFNIFHRELALQDALQMRGYDNELVRALILGESDKNKPLPVSMPTGLWVKSALPENVNLKKIKDMIGDLPVSWSKSPVEGIQRDEGHGHFAELVLGADAIRKIQAKLLLQGQEAQVHLREQGITGYLQEWILGTKGNIADSGTNLYVPPKLEELLFFDEEILTPLVHLIDQRRKLTAWTNETLEELRVLDASAAILGYEVTRYQHKESKREYLILSEREDTSRRRYWGTYIFRIDTETGYVVQVPRPLFEVSSFEAGVAMFESLHADELLIAGASPTANTDYSADMTNLQNTANLFNLVSQVLLREAGTRNMLVLQSRAFGLRPDQAPPTSNSLLSFDNGATAVSMLTPMAKRLVRTMGSVGIEYKFVDGSPDTVGYEVANLLQSRYISQSQNKEFGVLWLSPVARWGYRQQSENRMQQLQFNSVGVSTVQDSLYHRLAISGGATQPGKIPGGLRHALRNYLETQDVVSLYRASTQYPAFRMERLVDRDTQRAFLLVFERHGNRFGLAVNLSAYDFTSAGKVSDLSDRASIERYIESSAAWLEVGEGP